MARKHYNPAESIPIADGDYLKFFNATTGDEINCTEDDLLRIEAQDFDPEIYIRAFANLATNEGPFPDLNHHHGLLIGNREGSISRALFVSYYPDSRQASFQLCGIASYPHWDVERAISSLNNRYRDRDTIHESLKAIIREQVKYKPDAVEPAPKEKSPWSIGLKDKSDIVRDLILLAEGAEHSILSDLADEPEASLMELLLASQMFLSDAESHGVALTFKRIISVMVPDEQHDRLAMQLEVLSVED